MRKILSLSIYLGLLVGFSISSQANCENFGRWMVNINGTETSTEDTFTVISKIINYPKKELVVSSSINLKTSMILVIQYDKSQPSEDEVTEMRELLDDLQQIQGIGIACDSLHGPLPRISGSN